MSKKKMTKAEQIVHEKKYVEFLRVRLESENYKEAATPEEYALTQQKYEKAKFKLKMMLM